MTWESHDREMLPENDGDFDDAELASAIASERNRQYAALFETGPRWLDDVA